MSAFIDPICVLSAGSLRHAFPAIIAAFGLGTNIPVTLSLGPAGVLRERIEAGEYFDLYASANMAHPRRLNDLNLAADAVCFARNRLCVLARSDLELTTDNFIDVIANPAVKIGTSTPGDDPSGDYAFEVFDRIEAAHPGLGKLLKSRALQLVGGRNSPLTPPGKGGGWLITEGHADLFLSYHSNARLLRDDPALSIVALPTAFSPAVEYGLATRLGANSETQQLAKFVLSKPGQIILAMHGFEPVRSIPA